MACAAAAAPALWRWRPVVRARAAFFASRARASASAHDDDEARRSFREALRLRPDDVDAQRRLASLELAKGNWEVALLELQSIEQFAPDDPDAFVAAAKLMLEKGWVEAPEAALDRAIELAPARTDARRMRAEIRLRLGRYYGAREDAAAAGPDPALQAELARPPPRAGPRSSRIDGRGGSWNREQWPGRLGDLRDRLESALHDQRWSDAQDLVAEAARVAPDSAFGPFTAGIVQLAHGTAEAAEQDFSAALADAPRFPTVVGALGRAWAKQGGAAFAGDRLMQLAERDPQLAPARYLAARAFVEAGDPLKAEGALRRGLQLQPASPIPWRQLTDYYFGLDRAPEALEVCQQGVDRFPRDVALRMMMAQIEAGMGRSDEAIGVYQQLSIERPDLDLIQYKLATALAARRQDDPRFLEIVHRLQVDQPSDPLQTDALGWLLFGAGELGGARALLESAVRDLPGAPSPRFHLAAVSAKQGDKARAQEALKAALASPQPFPERLDAIRLLHETSPSPSAAADSERRR